MPVRAKGERQGILNPNERHPLSLKEEAVIVAFRRHMLLPLEFKRHAKGPGTLCRAERLYALQPTIPHPWPAGSFYKK